MAPAPPRLYLITPSVLSLADFPDQLAAALDTVAIACLRLDLPGATEDAVAHAADLLRPICHARDVPIVATDHFRLARRLGLDGVHLSDGARHVKAARKELGTDAIVGVYAQGSRHEGMSAAELGADYVSFGPVTDTGLGDGKLAEPELFAWWAQMIEVPVVAEGGVTTSAAAALAGDADFIALGAEIWADAGGAAAALIRYAALLPTED